MSRYSIILAASAFLLFSPYNARAYSAFDIGEMGATNSCMKQFADGYILGIAEYMEQRGAISLKDKVDYDTILKVAYWYISFHPEIAAQPAGVVVENALLEAYFKKKK